jgi:hypothetical protein
MASSLPLAAAMGKEHGCTTATGIAGVWPNTAVEGGTAVLSGGGGGYTPYGTSEKHR